MDAPSPDSGESELLRRAARGEAKALHELFDQNADYLLATARSLVKNQADAEDLVQETILAAMRALKSYRGQSRFRTWLVGILLRQRSALRRRQRVREAQSLEKAVVAAKSSGQDFHLDLAAALEALPPEFREVFVLREYAEMSYDEIARALSLPRGTVESRLFRARAKLRELMQAYQAESPVPPLKT